MRAIATDNSHRLSPLLCVAVPELPTQSAVRGHHLRRNSAHSRFQIIVPEEHSELRTICGGATAQRARAQAQRWLWCMVQIADVKQSSLNHLDY